jgi:hypothetical protein
LENLIMEALKKPVLNWAFLTVDSANPGGLVDK